LAKKKKIITDLLLTGIADKGKCIGRTIDGQVIFADGGVPGDIVDVMVLKKKKSYSEGVVTEIKHLSAERVSAPCIHFGICGGCKWQHLDYAAQLKYKWQIVKDAISRIGKINQDIVLPVIGCEHNYHYRNKLEYSFSSRRWITQEEADSGEEIDHTGALGFHKSGFFDKVVPINECLLQENLTNEIRNFIRDFTVEHGYPYYDLKDRTGLMRNMIVRNTTLGEWMVNIVFAKNEWDKIDFLMQTVKDRFPQITSLNYTVNTKANDTIFDQEIITYHGRPYIIEQLGDVQYRIGTKSFFQTNTLQAKVLFDVAVEFAELTATDNVYDLYTGLGSIALYIASKVKHVTGIEEVPEAIADANINQEVNGIKNTYFYAGDVSGLLNEDFVERHGKPDIIITDPPRQGMHENVVKMLLRLEAPRLVYISCNPSTQARDLALLNEKYEVVKVQPVDMFPHTHHIESVAQLKLRKT